MKKQTNEYGDTFVKKTIEYSTDKKRNMELWDSVDAIAQEAIEKVANIAGVEITDLDDLQDVKEVVEHLTGIVKRRFNAEIPYIDQDY